MSNGMKKKNGGAPTLIIGLGGIGCKIAASVALKCSDEERENIRFVAMDTDANDLKLLENLGAGIKAIQTSSKQTVGEYLNIDKDACENWFPVNEVLNRKTVSEGAGQVRAISRLALSSIMKSGGLKTLNDSIDELYRLSMDNKQQALRVVIVSTCAGGTGSGLILPVAMYVRSLLTNNYQQGAAIIRGFLLMPEILWGSIVTDSERNNLRCNAYATVRELNAFMMKGSGCCDSDRNLERYKNLKLELPHAGTADNSTFDLLPFDFCFLFDAQNMDGSKLTSATKYFEHAANCIYAQSIGPTQSKAFSGEDNTIREMCYSRGRNRYCGAGTAIVEYPYQSVRDYIAYKWSLDRINGGWTHCDKEYEQQIREYNQHRMMGSQEPEPQKSDVYIQAVDTGADGTSPNAFLLMVKNQCMDKQNSDISTGLWNIYVDALGNYVETSIMKSPAIETAVSSTPSEGAIDLSNAEEAQNAYSMYSSLKNYERVVNATVHQFATSLSNSLFYKEMSMNAATMQSPYVLESHLKMGNGAVHPNAARYFLYNARKLMQLKLDEAENKEKNCRTKLNTLTSDDNVSMDLQATKKKQEHSLEVLVRDLVDAAEKNHLFDKNAYKERIDKVQESFGEYRRTLDNYCKNMAKAVVFKSGLGYIDGMIREFERFYSDLEKKTEKIQKRIEDLEEQFEYQKGSPVYYACATKECLEHFLEKVPTPSGFLSLPEELSGDIYDSIRKTVMMAQRASFTSNVNEKKTDIFEDVILEHWKKEVEESAKMVIDMNIIEALMEEASIQRLCQGQEITKQQQIEHVLDIFDVARQLSRPFIQKPMGEEPRLIPLCSYNRELKDIVGFDIEGSLREGHPSDVVSRYKLVFYQSIYGLQVKNMAKFSKPINGETMKRDAGEYYKAYFDLINQIGPDASTNLVITPHLDKTWHSIAVLPDLDDENQAEWIEHIHQSMIYGLLFESITYRAHSSAYGQLPVYRLQNEDGQEQEFIVSNGTACDKFYEVLDALYNNQKAVTEIMSKVDALHMKDKEKKCAYSNTAFSNALLDLEIKEYHTGETSLFEIPFMYYESLPYTMRNESEVFAMVECILKIFEKEVYESVSCADAPYFYCLELEKQFGLMIENIKKFDSMKVPGQLDGHIVIDIVFNKIRSVFKNIEPQDYEERVRAMRALIR